MYVNLLAILILICVSCQLIKTSDNEHRLVHYLFAEQDYNPLIRPTQYSNETLVVSFGLLLVQLIHVFEKEQVVKTNTWLHMKWYDPQLRWNPQRYGGIDKINIPHAHVWTPDVVLLNNADGNYEVTFKCKVVLMHTGIVHWVPPAIYKSSCRIDVKYFPFDIQKCEMRFASWTYNAREVMFEYYSEEDEKKNELTKLLPQQVYSATSNELYKDDYLESGTWDVVGIPSQFVHYYSNTSNLSPDYIEIVVFIKMRRKALYYTVNLIVPTFLMTILICIVFCLPTAAGEKMTLCMSILLALNLFQLLVTKILPPTSAVVPLIAKYLLFTFALNVLVIINTVIITNFYYRTSMTDTMPNWLREIFLNILPRYLWLESSKLREKRVGYELSLGINDEQLQPIYMKVKAKKGNRSDSSDTSYINNKRRTSTMLMKRMMRPINPPIDEGDARSPNGRQRQMNEMRRDLRQALSHIRIIASDCARRALLESIRDEWESIATVIDRLQFVIFFTITILGSLALLFQVSHIFLMDHGDPKKLVRFSNPNMTTHKLLGTGRT
ncbi:unnamed protein product [Adineta ricciae]|uniref:Uncharacterized protein n=1 Tax=Adineta ricciae TaxID=249248 RepID=A0A814UEW0_ADIRI|nr:unnamed protein product [Adineta ricciae]